MEEIPPADGWRNGAGEPVIKEGVGGALAMPKRPQPPNSNGYTPPFRSARSALRNPPLFSTTPACGHPFFQEGEKIASLTSASESSGSERCRSEFPLPWRCRGRWRAGCRCGLSGNSSEPQFRRPSIRQSPSCRFASQRIFPA